MKITIILYATLREKLPPEAKGRAELSFPKGTTVQDVLDYLDVPRGVIVTVNEEIEGDASRVLGDGDLVRMLRPSKGG